MKKIFAFSFLFCLFFLVGCNEIDEDNKNELNYSRLNSNYKDMEVDAPIEVKVSSYTTEIKTDDDDRYNNITIVRDRLNNYVLKVGETFSYNDVCGPYGEADGFEKAPVLLSDGSHKEGFRRWRLSA